MSAIAQAPADLFFFGPHTRRLYGALHDARTAEQRECGIVLCYPTGQEYIHAHRAFRHLAQRLADAGFPVLRFDYGGTGDSSGDDGDASLAPWRDDIGRACGELRDRAGVESICLIGLRLGASLALEVAARRSGIAALVLWDPVITGADYLAELREQHRELLWRYFDRADQRAATAPDEVLGFPLGPALRDDLAGLDLRAVSTLRARRALIVLSQESPPATALSARLRDLGGEVAERVIPSFATWREDIDKGLVPDALLRGIEEWAIEVLP